MALTRTELVKFVFENSNGVLYDVIIDPNTGEGVARKHGVSIDSTPSLDNAETVLEVDSVSLSDWLGWHVSRKIYSAVYNTATDLDTILNASS